ncbi:MAG: hypothetical protein ABIH68_01510 [bacterium]
MKKVNLFLFFALHSLLFTLFGCSPAGFYPKINSKLMSDNYAGAVGEIQKNRKKYYPSRNNLLYFLDYGLLNHLAGNFAESNKSFEDAKQLADDYFTKSVTKEAATFLINDSMRPYYGEDFERSLIYFFKAVNYAAVGETDEALVEARQLNHFLQTLQTNYGRKTVYKEDPAIRYIMGMLYEESGETNDALIEYKKAIEAYEGMQHVIGCGAPESLIKSAILCAEKLGFSDDIDWFEKKYKVKAEQRHESSEIILIHLNGPAPQKINHFIEISFGDGLAYAESVKVSGKDATDVEQAKAAARGFTSKKQFRVAFPQYIQPEFKTEKIEVAVSGGEFKGLTEKVSDISLIAMKNLSDRIARIRTKAIARAWTKHVLAQKAEEETKKKRGELTGLLVGGALRAVGAATEIADLRTWGTLPAEIGIARIPVKAGTYHLRLYPKDGGGNTIGEKVINDVIVGKNKKIFLTVRTLK